MTTHKLLQGALCTHSGAHMAGPKFPSRGQAPVPPPLVLNWAAESLDESVRTRREASHWEQPGRPELPVLTGAPARTSPSRSAGVRGTRRRTSSRPWPRV